MVTAIWAGVILLLVGLPVMVVTAVLRGGAGAGRGGGTEDELSAGAAATPAGEGSVPFDSASPGLGAVRRLFTWQHAIAGGVLAFAIWGVVAAGWIVAHCPL